MTIESTTAFVEQRDFEGERQAYVADLRDKAETLEQAHNMAESYLSDLVDAEADYNAVLKLGA